MDTIPGQKQGLPTQASLLARSALCGDGEERAPRALAGHHHSALTPGTLLSSFLSSLGSNLGGSCRKAAGQTEWRVETATSSRRDPLFLGWGREGQWVLREGKASELCFCQPLPVSLQRGLYPQTSRNDVRSFASRCLYLPGPAGTLPPRPHGQRVG